MHDIRLAARLLLRSPGYTFVALFALAMGLGTTVAIFGAVYAILYRPLALPGAGQVVVPASVNRARGIDRASVPYADYVDWRRHRDVFEGVAVYQQFPVDLSGDRMPERLQAAEVSEEYFGTLRTNPVLGRVLRSADHEPGAPPVVVLSERIWRNRFGADSSLVGRDVRLAGRDVTVAGIVSDRRMWPLDVDAWLPLAPATLPDDTKTRRDNMIFQSVARLRSGTELEQGRALVQAIAARVALAHPDSRKDWSSTLLPLRDSLIDADIRIALHALMIGAGLVLLIACVNLANMLLARGTDRAREIAVRAAMGASRRRIVRQLVTENALLACLGGAAGLLLAQWLIDTIAVAAGDSLPLASTIRVDGVVVLTALTLIVATTIGFGLGPALTTSAAGSFQTLRQGRTIGPARGRGLRDGLVVVEIALAIVLLAGSGLTARSLLRLLDIDPGVDVERVLTGRLSLPEARYQEQEPRVRFWERLIADVATLPGVDAAAAGSFVPAGAGGFGLGRVFLLEGQAEPPASSDHAAFWTVATPDYFTALGIRVRKGRAFTSRDTASSPPAMIINETMARRVFGERNPIGARMRSWRDENVLREVVGVVSDVRYFGLADEAQSLVYVPHAQDAWRSLALVVRTDGDPALLAEALRRTVARHDPDLAVADVRPLSVDAARSIGVARFGAWLFALFAGAAAVLAGIGIYGVMAYSVGRRRHEIAVRLALGSTPAAASSLVFRHGLILTAIGAAVGLAGGLGVGRLMAGILYGIEPFDPITFVTVPVVLGAVALAACAIPARRAARIEPMAALRAE